MHSYGFIILVAVVWFIAMLRLLPRAWRLDHLCPNGSQRREPRELPRIKVNPLLLQPLLSLCL
jgi:hypothetical protein